MVPGPLLPRATYHLPLDFTLRTYSITVTVQLLDDVIIFQLTIKRYNGPSDVAIQCKPVQVGNLV